MKSIGNEDSLLARHPWVREPMRRRLNEREDDVRQDVLSYGEIPEKDDRVRCLKSLSLKQIMHIKGTLRGEYNYWRRQAGCDMETQLAWIALQAVDRRDYTLGVIYRYIDEEHIDEALKIN